MKRGPKPRVEYRGQTYTCRKWLVEIPDLEAIGRSAALLWLIQNTIPTGVGIRSAPKPNPYGLSLATTHK